MPLWDSVQRSLEKATQEAARIAKTQRLRSIIDGLSRQVNTQQTMIFNRTMDLFLVGQLTQGELVPLCQELVQFQQQLSQAQFELKHLQSSQAQPGAPGQYPPATDGSGGATPAPYAPGGEESAQSAYQAYLDSTQGITVPPPPPGVEAPTIAAMETVIMTPAAANGQRCRVCQAELAPGVAFCHNCGAPVQDASAAHSPTIRAGQPGEGSEQQNAEPGNLRESQGNEGV
jgi:hypothetical protein